MEGNVSFYQVNLVSRITGEEGGGSFEGRGSLVLIKSERGWRGGRGGQFAHVSYKSFQGDKSDGFGTSLLLGGGKRVWAVWGSSKCAWKL